jgi:DNA (cytosine-5)-methyltransferase 1
MTKGEVGAAKPLKTMSLFSGIGGIETGLAETGAAQILAFCESWDAAQQVLRARFDGVPIEEDVTRLKTLHHAELVTAGFPCTDISQAGRTLGLEGVQSVLVLKLLHLVRHELPTWLLLENVPNMLHLGRGRTVARIIEELEAAGYLWAYRTVDSRFTGLAQRRRRVIILASLAQDPAPLLLAEDALPRIEPKVSQSYGFSWTEGNRGVGWAVGAVPTLKGGSTVRVASPPAVWIPSARRGRRIVRPSIRSVELLQGFEAGWTELAPDRDRWKLVGNAVSTRVAAWVGERLVGRYKGLRDRDEIWTEDLLLDTDPWPGAARGGNGKRWRALVSEFPRQPGALEQQDLKRILADNGCDPLSYRATKGFRDRLIRSRLNYLPEFERALNEHIEHYAP